MNGTLVRSTHVSEAVAEPMPIVTGTEVESFSALYERTFPRVYAYVYSLLRDRAAAEDVTAQAFERAYRKRAGYRSRRGTLEAWLFAIARNAALDELRRRGRIAELPPDPDDRTSPGPPELAEAGARRAERRTRRAQAPQAARRARDRSRGPGHTGGRRARRAGVSQSAPAVCARDARRPRARPARPEVLRRPLERRDRRCARHVRDERRHPAAPDPDEAAKGLP